MGKWVKHTPPVKRYVHKGEWHFEGPQTLSIEIEGKAVDMEIEAMDSGSQPWLEVITYQPYKAPSGNVYQFHWGKRISAKWWECYALVGGERIRSRNFPLTPEEALKLL